VVYVLFVVKNRLGFVIRWICVFLVQERVLVRSMSFIRSLKEVIMMNSYSGSRRSNTAYICALCGRAVCYQYDERSMSFHLVNNDNGFIHKCDFKD
jgi:hypothetical protein